MNARMQHKIFQDKSGRNISIMSLRKITLLVLVLSFSLSAFALSASAASRARTQAAPAPSTTATADSVGIVDRGEILNNHPGLAQARQQLANIARQKENEAKAAADKETDTAKKAQAVQAKRMELAQEEQKLMAPIYRDCEQAVREVAVRKKLTLVLDKFVVLIGGVDITQDVIQQLARK